MKIALCFYGQPRSVENGYQYFKKFILDKHDVDIYAHLWEHANINAFFDLYSPITYKVEKQINFIVPEGIYGIQPWHGEHAFTTHAFNSISQAYSYYECNKLRNSYSSKHNINYDLIIKARTDTKIYCLDMEFIKPNMYNVPAEPSGFIYNDVIAFCSSNISDIIANKYENFNTWYSNKVYDFIPESLNYRVLQENDIDIYRLENTHINLIR